MSLRWWVADSLEGRTRIVLLVLGGAMLGC